MPLALVLFVMASLLAGFYMSENHQEHTEQYSNARASSIAANMIAFRQYIIEAAKFQDENGQTPNYTAFAAYSGLGSAFIDSLPAANRPLGMAWFQRMPGVDAYISGGNIYVYYVPTDKQGAEAEAGVQAALLEQTDNSSQVGKAVPSS